MDMNIHIGEDHISLALSGTPRVNILARKVLELRPLFSEAPLVVLDLSAMDGPSPELAQALTGLALALDQAGMGFHVLELAEGHPLHALVHSLDILPFTKA